MKKEKCQWYAIAIVLMVMPGLYMGWKTYERAVYLSDYFGTDLSTELLGRLFPAVVSLMFVFLGMGALVLIWKGDKL